jgi:hypothetical protein
MIRQGFSTRQVIQLHEEHVLEAAKQGIQPTRDTFIMLDDIYNIAKKRVQELYQKHKNDAISVRMWTEKNPEFFFIYQEHELVIVNHGCHADVFRRTDDRTMAAGASVTWTHCSVLFEVTWG